MGLAVGIGLCAAIGAVWDALAPDPMRPQGGVTALVASAAIVFIAGMAVFRYGKGYVNDHVSRREAIVAVSLIWVAAGAGGAIPFVLGANMSLTDSFFEAVSGLTTTGATVVDNIEGTLTRPLLLWRSAIQWLGGMGIVVLFVAIFPNLGAGGKHMFRGEVPGATSEGLKPRIAETSLTLWKLYAAFTVLLIAILSLLGMELFDALCHALTTMSTGGFSTLDDSIGGFNNSAFEYTIACFMLIGSVNYGLYYAALRTKDWRVVFRSIEFRAFVSIVVFSVVALTLFNLGRVHPHLSDSFRNAFFTVATTISSTGYGVDDYTAFSHPAFTVMLILMFLGGCSGSTAGGIKIERAVLLGKQAAAQIRKSFRPSAVQLVRMGRSVVSDQVLADVAAFVAVYVGCLVVGIFVVTSMEGVPPTTAFGAMLSCLSNMGPAPYHLGVDNFASYSVPSKLFFSVAMLLGRLEFFTLFALVIPSFWKH